jgi:hypothetical protein
MVKGGWGRVRLPTIGLVLYAQHYGGWNLGSGEVRCTVHHSVRYTITMYKVQLSWRTIVLDHDWRAICRTNTRSAI